MCVREEKRRNEKRSVLLPPYKMAWHRRLYGKIIFGLFSPDSQVVLHVLRISGRGDLSPGQCPRLSPPLSVFTQICQLTAFFSFKLSLTNCSQHVLLLRVYDWQWEKHEVGRRRRKAVSHRLGRRSARGAFNFTSTVRKIGPTVNKLKEGFLDVHWCVTKCCSKNKCTRYMFQSGCLWFQQHCLEKRCNRSLKSMKINDFDSKTGFCETMGTPQDTKDFSFGHSRSVEKYQWTFECYGCYIVHAEGDVCVTIPASHQ